MMMQITVNGKLMDFTVAPTGAALLEALAITPATVVAELNGEVVKREDFLARILADADVLELVTVVGGG